MTVKELFEKSENGTLTFEQFQSLAKNNSAKFTDLSEGVYVSKQKYDNDISAKDGQITALNETIQTRDTDLVSIKKQLEDAGADAQKLSTLSTDLSTLQGKYDADIKSYQKQLAKQAYEFAVKEFANGKKFTSNAAKRDFINSMIAKDLKMDKDKILGAEDFVTSYSTDNADAFVVDKPDEPNPTSTPLPAFVNPTPGPTPSGDNGAFSSVFNFVGVRPHEKNQ
jgi:hypothetical protein